MRLAAGYDRALAGQFFRRSLRGYVPAVFGGESQEAEVAYLAERLSETCVHGLGEHLGSPWYGQDFRELAERSSESSDRLTLAQAELAANQCLLIQGFLFRGLQSFRLVPERKSPLKALEHATHVLYKNAARAPHLTRLEASVLQSLSRHVREWSRILGRIPGSDYWDLLASTSSLTLFLSDEN